MMKILMILALTFVSTTAFADCMRDRRGDLGCGAGECAIDVRGDVACSQIPGGRCWHDGYGNVICDPSSPYPVPVPNPAPNGNYGPGPGPCATDIRGDSACAPYGGECLRDGHGNVACGAGECAMDIRGDVACSNVPYGRCWNDRNGNVICQ